MSTNIPQVAINDIGDEQAFLEAVDKTIKVFNDGDLVSCLLYTSPSPRD